MLVRLSVVVASKALAVSLCEALSDIDALVQTHPLKGNFWEQASTPSEVLVVSLSRLPEPVGDSVRSLSGSPSSPKLIVLTKSEDAELRATLLTCGAESVLNPTLDKRIWRTALQSVIERSRQQIEGRTQAELELSRATQLDSENSVMHNDGRADQLDWLPEAWRELPWTQLRGILLSACEHEYIRHHLTETKGRVGVVAKRTGLSNRAVNLMMKRQGLSKEPFRNQSED
jgi:response regulator RpfG family c-di-GMP phosphodiesterase